MRAVPLPSRLRLAAVGIAVSCALAGLGAAIAPGDAGAAAASWSRPESPTAVSAKVVKGGVKVTWKAPKTARPAVTNYVVHSGPGSCPVMVGPGTRSALMPVARGQSSTRPEVHAVNAYGYSPAARAPKALKVKASGSYRNVQLLQFSDFHGGLEASRSQIGAAVLATAFGKERKRSKSTFTGVSGDSIGGAPPISSAFDEKPTIEALNHMKVDVSAPGNHEHDRKLSHLRQMVDLSRFRWTVANYSTLAPLKGTRNAVKPYVIIQRGGVKVGFVGMNTPDTKTLVSPKNLEYAPGKRIEIAGEVAVVQKQVDAARKAGAEVVVVLMHQGWVSNEAGKALGPLVEAAGSLKRVAAVYGGHTHQPYVSITNGHATVQTRRSGEEYSRLQLCLNRKTGKVKGTAVQVVEKKDVEAAGYRPDKATADMVAGWKKKLGAKYDGKIGVAGGLFEAGGTPAIERSRETALGDITADALRARYKTDFVITNGGGIRDSLPAGRFNPSVTPVPPRPPAAPPFDILLGDVMTVYPFNTSAATSTVTGQQLWKALEHSVATVPGGAFPQISGFRFSFNYSKAKGSRIISVTRPNGSPIAADATRYTITLTDYIAFGGDGFGDLFNPTSVKIQGPLEDPLIDLFKADMAAGRTTPVPALDGRITRVGG